MEKLVGFCLALSTILFAQQITQRITPQSQSALSLMPSVEAQPKAHFVISGEWPLQWAGQTFTEEDQLQAVMLKNTSDQTITGFQLGWAMFIPEGCGVTEAGVPRGETHLAPYESRKVEPGETVRVGPYHFSSDSITTMGRHAHTPAVFAQIGLYRVRYSRTGEMMSGFQQTGMFGPEPMRYPCQDKETRDINRMHTFTSADGVFQFKHSELLVHCTEQPGGSWSQEDCAAYFPVCDDYGSQASRTLVCFAYPKANFEDAPTFEAAAFSVAEVNAAVTKKDCLSRSPDWPDNPHGSGEDKVVNGVKYKMFEVGEGGMSQGVDGKVYRTFHKNKCYQLAIRTAGASEGAFDPGSINEFSEADRNEVDGRLKKLLDSFRFLK